MANNRIVRVFKKLSKKEMKLLDKFVRSPIYNQHKDVIVLFDFFKKQFDKGNFEPTPESTFKAVFPKQKYKAQELHYVNSYLLKVVEQFLAWYEWQEDSNEPMLYLLRAYRKRRLDDQFERTFLKFEKQQEKLTLRNRSFYQADYRRFIEKVKVDSEKRSSNIPLQALTDAQDISFIIEKLYNACTMISHQAVVKTEYDTGLLKPLLEYLESSHWLKVPAVAVYYYSYKALSSSESTVFFKKLKEILPQLAGKFIATELKDHYLVAINFCIRQVNEGNRDFLRELFELYQSGLVAEVFYESGFLSRWTYNNIVLCGLQLKEYDVVIDFINNYSGKLPAKIREGNRNLNLAHYYYELKDFDQAMSHLNQTGHDDVLHNLLSKSLLARMYFENGETNALNNLLLSFKAYIQRKKGLGYHKTTYLNFIRYTKKLMRVNFYDKEAVAKLKSQIENEKYLMDRRWFLERVEKMR